MNFTPLREAEPVKWILAPRLIAALAFVVLIKGPGVWSLDLKASL